jgi:membrane protein DedA with SNARE-associated domain
MQSFLVHAGYPALILLAFLEACNVPISSEVIFIFAGVLAYQGHLNLAWVIVAGTLAELAGSMVSYAVGRKGGRPVVNRYGRYVLLTKADTDRAERFVAGHGNWAIPVARMLPLIRSFVSLVGGFADLPAFRFGLLSLTGTLIYVAATASIGYAVGPAWNKVAHDLSVAGYVVLAVVVVGIAAFVIIRLRELRRESAAEAEAAEEPVPPARRSRR